jgi:hypothetical protein
VAVPSGPPLKMAATTLWGTCGRGRRLNEQPLGGRPQANPGNVRRLRAVTGSKSPQSACRKGGQSCGCISPWFHNSMT